MTCFQLKTSQNIFLKLDRYTVMPVRETKREGTFSPACPTLVMFCGERKAKRGVVHAITFTLVRV